MRRKCRRNHGDERQEKGLSHPSRVLPEAKSRQTVGRDGFLGTASVYIVGLWSEVDLPGGIKGKRVIARTCRGWAVGAVKTASGLPKTREDEPSAVRPPCEGGTSGATSRGKG